MDRLRKFAFLIAGLVMAGAFAVACDSGTQEPAAPEPPTRPLTATDTPDPKASQIPESRFPTNLPEGVTAALPDNFPDELPIYPGAVPAQGKGSEVGGVQLSGVQLMTTDPPEKVYRYYVDKLKSEGWTIEDREGFAERNAISFSKGKCKASLLIAPSEDGGSDIMVVSEC